jgi:hypothetical protein
VLYILLPTVEDLTPFYLLKCCSKLPPPLWLRLLFSGSRQVPPVTASGKGEFCSLCIRLLVTRSLLRLRPVSNISLAASAASIRRHGSSASSAGPGAKPAPPAALHHARQSIVLMHAAAHGPRERIPRSEGATFPSEAWIRVCT